MSKIALLPGGFKPPHAGHYNMAKWLSANTDADTTIIFVGPKERDGITQEMSLKLWKLYTQNDSGLEVRSAGISPVRDVYDFVEKEAPEGTEEEESEVFLGIGDKDKTNKRYANIGKFAEPRNIKYKPVVVPPQAGGVSGTEMRGFIKMNDKALFQYSLPEHLSDEQKEQAWSIVTTGYLANVNENITDSKYITIKYKRENGLSKSEKFLKLKDVKHKGNYVQASDIKIVDKDTEKEDPKTSGKNKPFANPNTAKNIPDFLKDVTGDIFEGVLISTDDNDLKSSKNKTIKINGLEDRNNVVGRKFFIEPDPASAGKNLNLFATFTSLVLNEDFYNPEDKVLDYMRSSEYKAGYRGKKDIPRTKTQIHNRQTAPVSWEESVKEDAQFETGKVLHVYDFDDTIAQVNANIKTTITSPSGDYNKVILIPAANFPEESKELETRLGSLEIEYDFSEFEKQIDDAIVNSKVVNKLKNSLSRPDIKTTILTARSIGHPVTRYMREELGLAAYVVPLGLQVDGKVTGQDKANWIEKHINKGYKTIYFIDDSEENRVAVAGLKDKYPDIRLKVEDPAAVREMNEGPQFGVLYHFTQQLSQVLGDNVLKGPVSLTRSLDSHTTQWLGDQPYFVFDKDKLRTKYKITPFKDTSDDPDYEPISQYDEMEEVIKNDITDLARYIIKVVLPYSDENWENALKEKNIPYEVKALDEMMGMMNNQEKAKHAKNLKRLKKDTAKQGDQYMEVPKYIKGTLTRKLYEKMSASDVDAVEDFADKKLDPVDVDLTSDHFFDRLNDPRNKKEISGAELIGFFKRLSKRKKEFIEFLRQYKELVVTDDRTNINIPFMKLANKAIAKTVMRKPDFQTSNPQLSLERDLSDKEERIAQSLPDKEFKKRYGKNWKSVKIATATKMAKKESIQQMGYKINSPYKDRPFIDINSNKIDMDNLAYDQLKLIGDNGVEIIANNNSGIIIVPGATKVREIPIKMERMKKESVFSKNWWKQQINEILTETKANTHLTHLEELVLTQGQDGFNQAKNFLYELIKNLKGQDNTIKNVSVKWDGAPAIFTGINPDNGQFFVGTKSVFNINPKINYTPKDIDENHGHAPGLAKKLKLALQYLPALGIKGILQGDFMFDNDEVETNDIEGTPHYTFRPNTIRYAVEANSELGKKVIAARIGIIFHTTYNDLSGGGASFGADISGLSESTSVWFDDAYFKDNTGILLSDKEEQFVLDRINEADSINVDYTNLPLKSLNIYINSEIKQGEFLNDPLKSFERFKKWYQQAVDKGIAKVKRPETKEKKKIAGEEKLKEFESQKQDILNIFKVSKLLSEAKAIFITKYDKAVATKHFIDNGDGTLSVTKAEGFVAVDHTENGIKLVDRLEFSRNNFNAGKPGAKK